MASKRENVKTPTVEAPIPSTSRDAGILNYREKSRYRSRVENCFKYLYNKENKTVCQKSCKDWLMIICYFVMYFVLLSVYTMICLFSALSIIKASENVPHVGSARLSDLYNFVKNGVGLTATPTSENDCALIWYRSSIENDYQKYVTAIDKLISGRNNTDLVKSLGPCGVRPYGYDDKPCAIVRINKQLDWTGKPLSPNSSVSQLAPEIVKTWMRSGEMLWLHCDGHNLYDREHLGVIAYHPYPPGFDPSVFPLNFERESPLVAVQFSEYTPGVSVDVLCKLWYEEGPSSVHFTLYIEPRSET